MKKKHLPYYGYGNPPKKELYSKVIRSGKIVKGHINFGYTLDKNNKVTSFTLTLICFDIKDNDNNRVIGYDTKHRDKIGPCHKHCAFRKEPMLIQDCNFLSILKSFCEEIKIVLNDLKCYNNKEDNDLWKLNCE